MTLVLLARHGETLDNANRIFQGQGGKGLNRLGRAQAERLGQRLSKEPPDVIVTSDLERAVETAQIVAGLCTRDVELEPGLREVDVGLWTGKGYDVIAELYPEEWAAWEAGLDVRRGGGETYAELANRMESALDSIVAKHAKKRVLVVSHGGAIKSWIVKGLGLSGAGTRFLGAIGNTSLTTVEHDGRRYRMHGWNDIGHLQGLVVDEMTE